MSSVQIAQENMSIGEGRNLAPFVSTAEFYAKIYDADIVLHACNGRGTGPVEDNRVHVYMFAYPIDPGSFTEFHTSESKLLYTKSIYGFALPSDQTIVHLPGKHQIGENVGVFINSESV